MVACHLRTRASSGLQPRTSVSFTCLIVEQQMVKHLQKRQGSSHLLLYDERVKDRQMKD